MNLFGGDILQLVSGMALAVVVGVAACGGGVKTEGGGGGDGSASSHSGARDGAADRGNVEAGTGRDASQADAVDQCLLESGDWHCPMGRFAQCPSDIASGSSCTGFDETDCLLCSAGIPTVWSCYLAKWKESGTSINYSCSASTQDASTMCASPPADGKQCLFCNNDWYCPTPAGPDKECQAGIAINDPCTAGATCDQCTQTDAGMLEWLCIESHWSSYYKTGFLCSQ